MAKRSGFTLIEMSIVLTIIALVIGSVVAGNSLVRAAAMRKIHKEFQDYVSSMHTFRTKYNCMAGDCDSAEEFFDSDPNGCPPPMDSGPVVAACNGNGNGILDQGLEEYEAWRQLSDAGVVSGNYSGARHNGNVSGGPIPFHQYSQAGYNCPAILNAANCWIWIDISNPVTFDVTIVDRPEYGKTVLAQISTAPLLAVPQMSLFPIFSDAYAMSSVIPAGSWLFTTEEALTYDTKYDDGNPITGTVMAQSGSFIKRCTTTQTASAQYDLSKSGRNCAFFYRTGF
jgi:prepilin-type N-terminal cleavage/methylation domain-containing protein